MIYSRTADAPETTGGAVGSAGPKTAIENRPGEMGQTLLKRGDIEPRLKEMWRTLLKRDSIETSDDFFELGGHSPRVASLVSMIHREFDVRIGASDVFRHPTLGGLAEFIGRGETDPFAAIASAGEREDYPQSPAQRRLFLLSQMMEIGTAYNITAAFRVHGALDARKLNAAFQRVIERHDSLRTSFAMRNGEPVQVVHARTSWGLDGIEAPASPTDAAIADRLEAFVRPFAADAAPLMRAGLLRLSPADHILILDIDHKICDGISLILIVKDLFRFYQGETPAPPRIRYMDFTVWQQRTAAASGVRKQAAGWAESARVSRTTRS